MKKLILTAIVAIFAISAASAQDKGQWGVGPKLSVYTNVGTTVVGIGAVGRYSITDTWRLEPALAALLHSGCSIDLSCDVHYIFDLGKGWNIYPLAGLTANDIGKWAVGMNIGAGTDYSISRNWDISASLKWQPMFDSFRKNGVIITLGGTYKF